MDKTSPKTQLSCLESSFFQEWVKHYVKNNPLPHSSAMRGLWLDLDPECAIVDIKMHITKDEPQKIPLSIKMNEVMSSFGDLFWYRERFYDLEMFKQSWLDFTKKGFGEQGQIDFQIEKFEGALAIEKHNSIFQKLEESLQFRCTAWELKAQSAWQKEFLEKSLVNNNSLEKPTLPSQPRL